jgi:hypothetical protein
MRMRAVRWIRFSAVMRSLTGLAPVRPTVGRRTGELFRTEGDADFADALRAATNGGWAFGAARFKRQIAKALDRQGAQPPGCAAAEGPTAEGAGRIDGS